MAHWTIVCTQKDINIAKSFCRQLSSCGGPLGMEISEPSYTEVRGINVESFLNSINIAVNKNRALQLIVIIFPNQREDRYNAVKRICCAQIGIPSQVTYILSYLFIHCCHKYNYNLTYLGDYC